MTQDQPDIKSIEPCGSLDATVNVPGSKSITNRALVCAALADGTSRLERVLCSDDTRAMIDGLRQLGIAIEWDLELEAATIIGRGGKFPVTRAAVDVLGSGTTMRFLTAVACLAKGEFTIDGNARMRERPIGELIQSLRQLGCELSAANQNQFPPVQIVANGIHGGEATIDASRSSQFLSALLMVLPYASQASTLSIQDELVSSPFIQVTLDVMEAFGVKGSVSEDGVRYETGTARYRPTQYSIEPDATAASYFWGAAAICGGSVTVSGLNRHSIQGDMQFVDVLRKMGCKTVESTDGTTVMGPAKNGVDVDMGEFSDTVQTLAAISLFVDGTTTIRGIAHNQLKESNRIHDLARELRRVGAVVETTDSSLQITPAALRPADFETYDDHRMAMALSLIGLKQPGIQIRDPGCVSKTFPDFFERMQKVTDSARNN